MSTNKTRGERTAISAHCIVRFFERHYGVDIEEIKKQILPDYIKPLITADAEKYVIDDLEFRIQDNVILTCVPVLSEEPQKKIKNRPKRHKSNEKTENETWQAKNKYSKKHKKGGYR